MIGDVLMTSEKPLFSRRRRAAVVLHSPQDAVPVKLNALVIFEPAEMNTPAMGLGALTEPLCSVRTMPPMPSSPANTSTEASHAPRAWLSTMPTVEIQKKRKVHFGLNSRLWSRINT